MGPARERSPTLPSSLSGQCATAGANNNHPLNRMCSSCPDTCEHHTTTKQFGPSPIFNDSCRRYIKKLIENVNSNYGNDGSRINSSNNCSYDTSDRATVFDESSINYSDGSRNDCTELVGNISGGIPLKTEPCPPSSPESSPETLPGPDDCAGCGRLIQVIM